MGGGGGGGGGERLQSIDIFVCVRVTLLQFLYVRTFFPVLDIGAFERLLGPCMNIMKRNFSHYEEQLMELFGENLDITDSR